MMAAGHPRAQAIAASLRQAGLSRSQKHDERRPRYRLRGVEVFAAGQHRGKDYTSADLDDMVANFHAFSTGPRARLRVPGKIGHAEHSEADESGKPAAGRVVRLWREGPVLKADLEDIAPPEAEAIAARRYFSTSSEIYDSPPAGIPGRGKMLRSVAFLGADQPQVKGLAEVPQPERYAEGWALAPARGWTLELVDVRQMPGGYCTCFSEVTAMDEEAKLLEALSQHGIDTEALAGCPPAALAEVLRVLEARDHEEDELEGEVAPPASEEEKHAFREKAHHYWERGLHHHHLAGKYAEHARRHAEHCGLKLEEYGAGPDHPARQPGPGHTSMNESIRAAIRAELQALVPDIEAKIDRFDRYAEERLRADKKAAVEALVEDLVRQGKVPPREKQGEIEELLLADDSTLHRFSENGKPVSATLFDRKVKRLRARPSKFAELVGTAVGTAAGKSEDEQIAELEAHYEAYSEQCERAGLSRELLISGFKAERKQRPRLTAAEFLGK